MTRMFQAALSVTLCAAFLGCKSPSATMPAAGPPDANDPLSVLPDLAKAHKDKIDFSWYATSMLRSVAPEVKAFAEQMHKDHTRLRKEVQDWAAANKVDVTYHYEKGIVGDSLKAMEKMQGDLLQGDDKATFQRDYLILTWTDLDWQRNLVRTTLAQTKNAGLKAYLQDSLDTQTREREQCRELLAKYKW